MMIHLGIYEGPRGRLLLDATARGAKNIKASTNIHGFERLVATVPISVTEAWSLYDYGTIPYVRLRANSFTVWEGYIEEPELFANETSEGINIIALGAWNSLKDIWYSAFWSHSSTADWRPLRTSERNTANPDLYVFDNNNRLRIGLLKNATYRNNNDFGEYVYRRPHKGATPITHFTANYDYNLPPSWRIQINQYSGDPGNDLWYLEGSSTIATVSGSGSGTINATNLINCFAIGIAIYNASGASFTNGFDNGAYFLRLTQPRLSYTAPPITLAKIIAHIATFMNNLNPDRISAETALIGRGLALSDIDEVIYADADATEVIRELIELGDAAGNEIEAAIWEDRVLRVNPRNAFGAQWAVDATDINVSRPVLSLYNLAFGTFQETDGTLRRGNLLQDMGSINKYNIRRGKIVKTQSTRESEADRLANVVLNAAKNPRPKARYRIKNLLDLRGGMWPKFLLRANDTLLIRGIPSGFGTLVDTLRNVRVTHTDYDVDNDTITFEPELPLTTIASALSRALKK